MPAAVLTTYLVIAPLPVVVEDDGEALSYGPGTVFEALSNNPSVVRLLELNQIVQVFSTDPVQGTTVVQGPPGPTGSAAATGWEDSGPLVALIDQEDQVSIGYASPPAGAKLAIDAAQGGFTEGLVIVNGTISIPGGGAASERFGQGTSANGACAVAVGRGATADFTNGTAVGKSAASTAAFGTALGTMASAGLDSTSVGAAASSDQNSVALGRGAAATGLRSFTGGNNGMNVGQDSVLVGAGGVVAADEVVVVGGGTALAAGAVGMGFGVNLTAVDATAWGRGASSGFANAHAFGPGATTTATNQLVFGSQANPIGSYYLGRGEAAVSAQDVRIASTRVATTQSDTAGSNLTLEAGPGTGNATPSRIFFQTAPAGPSGNSQQVLATQMIVGEGVDIAGWLNINSALAVAQGDIAASDGTSVFHWDAATPQLNLGTEGVVARLRGVAATSAGVDGASLFMVGGTGLTTGSGGAARVVGGLAGASGVGGEASLEGGYGVAGGGAANVYGGTSAGAAGGPVTLQGGAGTPAGAILVQGGLTNGVGGQSADATLSGGDASATMIALTGNAIVKGGDGLSNNNHGGHALIQGGVADGAGTHGYVQIETAGVARWRVDNAGHLLASADTSYDIGASGATRPRTGYFGTSIDVAGGQHVLGATTAGFFGATPVSQQADIGALTDSTGGTVDNTVAAVSGSGDDATINNNFADLTDQVNQLRTTLRNLGLMA